MAKTATKAATKPAETTTKQTVNKPAANKASAAKVETVEPKDVKKLQTPAVRPQSTAVAAASANLPAHMQGDVDLGKEDIGRDDMDMPRLKLMQGLSNELTVYDDLRAGNFFHTAAEMIFDEPVRVVPIFFDKQYILWRPLEAGGGILARAQDGIHWSPSSGEFKVKLDKKDGGHEVVWNLKAPTVQESGLANWGTMNPADSNSPPAATMMYNFLLAFPDHPDLMPAVLTFQRTSVKIGRKLLTKIKTVRTPLFGSVFTLSSFDDHNGSNQSFKNINMTGAGLVEDPDLYESYKQLHLSIKGSGGLKIKDIETAQTDPDDDTAGNDGRPAY